MDRKEVDSSIRQIDLQPIAAPIQSYVAPGPSPLRDLAQGLGKFDKGLAEFEDQRAKKQADEDKLRGQAEFYKDNDGSMAEAVSSGKIPAQWSPAFVRGFKHSQGDFQGTNLQSDFQAAYDAWDGKDSEDPHAYETFVHGWMAQNIPEGTDPSILRTLLPHVGAAVTAGANRHIEDRHKAVYGGMVDTTVATIGQDVDKASADGLSVPEGTNYEALWTSIAGRRELAIKQGVRPDDIDLQLMQSMSAKVLTTRDPGLLGFFDQKVPGKDYTYGESPDGIKIKKETLDSLDVINRRNLSDEVEATKAANKAAIEASDKEAGDLLANDPTKPLPESLLARVGKLDGGARARYEGWRSSFAKRLPSDNQKVDAVYSEMYAASQDGRDPVKVWSDAASQGVFTDPEDASKARAMADKLASNKDAIKAVFDDQSYKTIEKVIAGRTQGVDSFTGDPMVGMSDEGLEAQYDLRQKATQWALQHPNATSEEQAAALSAIGKGILENMTPPEAGAADNGSGLIYNRDTKQMSFPNPYSPDPNAPPPEKPAPAITDVPGTVNKALEDAKAKSGKAPQAAAPVDPEVQDALNGMPAEQRKSVDERAKAFGMSTEEYMKKLLAPKVDPTTTNSIQPISYKEQAERTTTAGNPVMTQEIANKLIEDSLSEIDQRGEGARTVRNPAQVADPRAGRLLDLIKVHEAGGNYNAVYGKSGSKRNLGAFSLNQILAMQVAARSRGVPSTAIGGYQFIYKTLRGLKGSMGLTGDEKFTPRLQDMMAMQLLRQRGYDAFKAGRLSKRAFALRIAQEWASFPNPNTGRSVYAGDGLNASSVHPSRVLQELGLINA